MASSLFYYNYCSPCSWDFPIIVSVWWEHSWLCAPVQHFSVSIQSHHVGNVKSAREIQKDYNQGFRLREPVIVHIPPHHKEKWEGFGWNKIAHELIIALKWRKGMWGFNTSFSSLLYIKIVLGNVKQYAGSSIPL